MIKALILGTALFVAIANPAFAQRGYDEIRQSLHVPVMVDGAWTFPQRPTTRHAAVEDYSTAIDEACAYYGCNPAYLESVMMCESGGDPNAVAYNPVSGNYTYGLYQIDAIWGGESMTPIEQIWFAAKHLTAGDIWWACG